MVVLKWGFKTYAHVTCGSKLVHPEKSGLSILRDESLCDFRSEWALESSDLYMISHTVTIYGGD